VPVIDPNCQPDPGLHVRRILTLIPCAAVCVFSVLPATSSAASSAQSTLKAKTPPVGAVVSPPRDRPANAAQARGFLAIANALPKIRALRAEYPGLFGTQTELPSGHWQVTYYTPGNPSKEIGNTIISGPPKEIGLVVIDPRSGRVLEQWTGIQLGWQTARGMPGLLGGHVNALYIWLPLCVLFMLPFFNFRQPFSLLHLDLLVLLSFSVSLAFLNHAHVYASVPLVYPPLIYFLARMLALVRRGSVRKEVQPLRLLVPAGWLAVAVVLLIGFRIALNVTDSTVIDVGSAGPLGAQRIVHGLPLYGGWPVPHAYQDNYGPVMYEASIPFVQVFGYKEHSALRSRPAPHAIAIFFDLLAVAVLFLLGRRVRGPTLGIALAYAWVTYPFTLFALENNANDALIAVLLLAALLAATYRSKLAGAARGAFAALAGLTKFAPLAAGPVLATHGLRELPPARRPYALALFLAGFLGTAALVFIPALSHSSLHTFYERTIASTANRETPFSVWGLYGGLDGLQLIVRIAAVVLGLSLAVVPRRPDVVGLAAACAAAIIAVQVADGYWFYMYILWFFPLVMVALLGRFSLQKRGTLVSTPAQPDRVAITA
jgi:hypothetical protein